MSENGSETEESTEFKKETRIDNGGIEVLAPPKSDVRVTVKLIPPAVDQEGPATVDLSLLSETINGRFLICPDRAEKLGEQIVEAATAARSIEDASE
jgi:hypothetical protein